MCTLCVAFCPKIVRMSGKALRTVVVGLGGMGSRWVQVVHAHPASQLVGVVDVNADRAAQVAKETGTRVFSDWRAACDSTDVDALVVATPHVFLTEIATAALRAGKHVFTEKPGGTSSAGIALGVEEAGKRGLQYRVNFHLRSHPAVAEAKHKIQSGAIGRPLFCRGVYAHGGRVGYEQEWWCKKELSGGGELIDQGSHLIDLANWFLGDMKEVTAVLDTAYWNIAPLEDNAALTLRTTDGRLAMLHASWSQWRKLFRYELFGSHGYMIVEGLGGQYGTERLIVGPRAEGREAPQEVITEFPFTPGTPDVALTTSWDEFVRSVEHGQSVGVTAADGVATLKIIEAAYRSATEQRTVLL